MKLPFSIDRCYTTFLTRNQVTDELSKLTTEKHFGGLRTDKFVAEVADNSFFIARKTQGVDGFALEQYPVIEGIYFADNPVVINIIIKPSYGTIAFFALFVFTFIPAAIFVDKMTFNGVFKVPTLTERFAFSLVGIFPGLWCYFGYIRPVRKAQTWIINKLSLTETDIYSK